MIYVFSLLILFSLCILFLEDLKKRLISLIWVITFLIGALGVNYINGFKPENLILNFSILGLNFLGLFGYVFFRHRSLKLINTHLGLGDVILFFLFALLLSPINFLILIIFSSILGIGFHMVFKHKGTIPLVSMMSISYVSFILFSGFDLTCTSLQNDNLILKLF